MAKRPTKTAAPAALKFTNVNAMLGAGGLVVVTLGDTIQYLNDEDKEIDHNIYSLSRPLPFDLGLGERGSILEMDLKKTGQKPIRW